MLRGSMRRVVVATGIVVLAAGSLSLVGPAAVAKRTSQPASVIHLIKHVGPLWGMRHASSTRTLNGAGTTDTPLDPELYRVHSREGQELEGGDAIHEGERPAPGATVTGGTGGPTANLASTFDALNHFDSRYSDAGNQFSGEPPDQGLCASANREFEIVNSVVQVYTTNGHALIPGTSAFPGTEPVGLSLNQFFGVPTSFVRPDGPFGPFVFDVSCAYDRGVKRWFVLADWLALDPKTGDFSGPGGFYIAVSRTPKPLGAFDVYSVDTTNNGKNGTPNHHCSSGFCFGDFPHMAVNRRALVVTTNEFDNLGAGEFHGAQLYAFSKHDLVAGVATPTMAVIPNIFAHSVNDFGFSIEPVASQPADYVDGHGGTMYLGMSQSPYADATAHGISLWRLTNTDSINTSPALHLTETSIPTEDYAVPPAAQQRPGDTPLLDCENDPVCIGATNPVQQGPWPLDAGSGDVGEGWLRQGVVYLVAGAALAGNGGALIDEDGLAWTPIPVHAGVEYFGLRPSRFNDHVTSLFQGAADVNGQGNLLYPSIAMNGGGTGAIGVTLVGPHTYPSAAYVPFDPSGVSGDVVVAGAGVGPNDGFSATFDGGYRTRWGDYGAAAVAPGGRVWLASEYIAQTCDDTTFNADDTCGFTRTFFANWSTRLYSVEP
jgi:hypothetical protein